MDLQNILNNSVILSWNDISNFKNYISEKYEFENSSNRALILSDAINKVIDKSLTSIPQIYHPKIKKNIYINFIEENFENITKMNIFDELLSLEDSKELSRSDVISWVESVLSKKYPLNEILHLISIRKMPNSLIYELPQEPVDVEAQELIIESAQEETLNFSLDVSEVEDVIEIEEFEIPYFINCSHNEKTYKTNFTFNTKYILAASIVIALFLINLNLSPSNLQSKNQIVYEITSRHSLLSHEVSKIEAEIKLEKLSLAISRAGVERLNNSFTNFKYRDFNIDALKNFLIDKDSLLANEPYFTAIINISKENNYDPRLLFALTGQEQSFVPAKNSFAKEIANNPYNVFYSWRKYNTNIFDTTEIAIKTINNSLSKMPNGFNPFKWMNRTYAEDPNWWRGFQSIYKTLVEITT